MLIGCLCSRMDRRWGITERTTMLWRTWSRSTFEQYLSFLWMATGSIWLIRRG